MVVQANVQVFRLFLLQELRIHARAFLVWNLQRIFSSGKRVVPGFLVIPKRVLRDVNRAVNISRVGADCS